MRAPWAVVRQARPSVRLGLGAGIIAILSLALGYGVASVVKSPAQQLADTAPPPTTVRTAVVKIRQPAESINLDATVVRSASAGIAAPRPGDGAEPVITGLTVRRGSEVIAGERVAEVSGAPVIVLRGAFPAYRTMAPGLSGPDVRQLQSALRELGYRIADPPGVYGSGTSAAVTRLYQRAGYQAAVTGAEELTAATRALHSAKQTAKDARDDAGAAEALTQALEDYATALRGYGSTVPLGQVAFVPSLPATVSAVHGRVGATPGSTLISLQAGQLVIRAEVNPMVAGDITKGATVEVIGEEAVRRCRVLSVADTSEEVSTLTARCAGGIPARLQRESLRVRVVLRRADGPAITVPTSAVQTTTSGAVVVTVHAAGGDRVVQVAPGFEGGGYTQVTPVAAGSLRPGDSVVVGPADEDVADE